MLRVAEQYAGTDTGLQRRANEDSLLARAPLFVVADGMGGAQAGEVASKLAVESFRDGVPSDVSPEQALAEQALAANARIHLLSRENAEQAGMGTTLTAVYVGDREVAIAHVGDSRAYCLRDGELVRLTDDHSLVDELIREGRLTPAEAEEHPQRSIITRALGPEETVEVDTRSFRARGGDVYLLCSDGLTSMVPEARLAEILREHADAPLRDTGERLIAEANRAGGRDNVTVILLRLEEVDFGSSDSHSSVPLTREIAAPAAHAGNSPLATGNPPRGAGNTPLATGNVPPGAGNTRTVAGNVLPGAGSTPPVAGNAPPVARRLPRLGAPPATAPRARRHLRRTLPSLVVLMVLAVLAAGAYVASQSVYFIGTDARGLVTIYQGFPYKLPGGIKMYSSYYVSGVGASTLSPARRAALLNHKLRSEHDAGALVHSIELEELSE
jgi:PPM family protein phosphatase